MKKQPGSIDLVGLFEAAAQELQISTARGRILHKTKNIRDSGAPLERCFMDFLGSRLPVQFKASQGYLFDSTSICTPQIDTMIIDTRDTHEVMTSSEGAIYVPYTSARVIVEIKNSAAAASKHLDQVAKITQSIAEMRGRHLARRGSSSGPLYVAPVSLLICADSSDADLTEIQEWYSKNKTGAPNYTLFLDRGLIIAFQNRVFGGCETLSFYDYRSNATAAIFSPSSADEYHAGRALLWLYFALVAHLNLIEGNTRPILGFTEDVVHQYPLIFRSELHSASQW